MFWWGKDRPTILLVLLMLEELWIEIAAGQDTQSLISSSWTRYGLFLILHDHVGDLSLYKAGKLVFQSAVEKVKIHRTEAVIKVPVSEDRICKQLHYKGNYQQN